jgi:hypothetical protein
MMLTLVAAGNILVLKLTSHISRQDLLTRAGRALNNLQALIQQRLQGRSTDSAGDDQGYPLIQEQSGQAGMIVLQGFAAYLLPIHDLAFFHGCHQKTPALAKVLIQHLSIFGHSNFHKLNLSIPLIITPVPSDIDSWF